MMVVQLLGFVAVRQSSDHRHFDFGPIPTVTIQIAIDWAVRFEQRAKELMLGGENLRLIAYEMRIGDGTG